MTEDSTALMRLTGHQTPFRLTPAAHRELLSYLAEARRELAGDPDGDETVRDLEVSIGDQLSALKGTPVDVGQMRSTLDQVGPVVSEPGKLAPEAVEAQVPTWCRVLDGKWLTGVCLGIAEATESNVAWVRAICVAITFVAGSLLAPYSEILMLACFGLSVLAYLALTLLLPPVGSVAEYRQLNPRRKTARG